LLEDLTTVKIYYSSLVLRKAGAQDQLVDGFMQCMYATMPLVVPQLVTDAKNFAQQGLIDPVSNLAGSRVFVYSGTQDTVVNPKVVQGTVAFYNAFNANVSSEFSIPSEHTLPTNSYGNQ
jgi:hypothetical protein